MSSATEDGRKKDVAQSVARGDPIPNPHLVAGMQGAAVQLEKMKGNGSLTAEGVKIALDSQRLLATGQQVLIEKNQGEELQKIHAALKFIAEKSQTKASTLQQEYRPSDMSQAMEHLQNIVQAMVTSPGFRKIARKLNLMLLETLSSYSEEEKQHQSRALEHEKQGKDTFSDEGKDRSEEERDQQRQRASRGENAGLFSYSGQSRALEHERQGKATFSEEGKDRSEEERDQQRQRPSRGGKSEEGREDREEVERREGEGAVDDEPTEMDTEHTKSNYRVIIRGEEWRFLEESLNDEQLSKISGKLQNLLVDVAGDEQLKNNAFELINFASSLQRHFAASTEQVQDPQIEEALESIVKNAKVLLSRFASNHAMNNLDARFNGLQGKSCEDQGLQKDWNGMLEFLAKSVKDEEYVKRDGWRSDAVDQIRRVRRHLSSYRKPLFQFVQEIDSFLTDLREDQTVKNFAGATRQLTQDLFYDEQGRPALKIGALREFKNIVVPVLQEQVKYIALNDFTGSDSSMTFELSNILIQTGDLFPDMIDVFNSNHLRVSGQSDYANAVTSLYVTIKGIRLAADDLHLKYRRLIFPSMSDEGKLNVVVDGGMDLDLWLSGDAQDDRVFHVDDVNCEIRGLSLTDLQFRNHEALYYFFKPLLQYTIRKKIENKVEESLRESLISLDDIAISRLNQNSIPLNKA